jgi:hypothetical protein
MGIARWLVDAANLVTDAFGELLPVRCPIPWRPHALAPVFHGHRDLLPERGEFLGDSVPSEAETRRASFWREPGSTIDHGSPVPLRVLYPSIDDAPPTAALLQPCGRYPLVLLAHGQCSASGFPNAQREHYLAWARSRLARQLARAGYVVAIPELSGNHPSRDEDLDVLRSLLAWLRREWIHAHVLAEPPATALIGHSRGALKAARLIPEGSFAVYVSLSGDWGNWHAEDRQTVVDVLRALSVPSLFVFGSNPIADVPHPDASWVPPDGSSGGALPGTWEQIPTPRHRAELQGLGHFEYLAPGIVPCDGLRSGCASSAAIAADVVTMFLGRYLRPPAVSAKDSRVAASLLPEPSWREALTERQRMFSGSYLLGIDALRRSEASCGLATDWALDGGSTGIERLP